MKRLMPWFCLAASASVSVAFANEGMNAYRQGNYAEAAQKLAEEPKKDQLVDYYMGRMRLYGYGQLKNNTVALRYFTEAATKGYLPAQQMMASYALLEENNPEQALVWFKKAADANDVKAQMYCAAAYLFGVGTKKNADMARRYYIAAAKNGNSLAQAALADNFLDARQSGSKNLGLIWLNKAVAQNSPEAQLKLGLMYANGNALPRDISKAKEFIALSVAQGYLPAMVEMGALLRKEGNFQEAKNWYIQAANAHYIPAEVALAQLYMQDKTPLYDLHTAFLWMLKAAQKGSSEAQLALSSMYKNGQGIPADEKLAAEWQKRAALSAKDTPLTAQIKAAQWLTHGKATTLAASGYQLHGILSDWRNPIALKENTYNQAPKMDVVTREAIYHPNFVMTHPNDIAISEYYDALAVLLDSSQHGQLSFPRYPVDKDLAASQQRLITTSGSYVPDISKTDKGLEVNASESNKRGDTTAVNDKDMVDYLLGRASLGDSSAQFTLGQMYQEGFGVSKNVQEAIKYFKLASSQQELRAEYNMALIYLEGREVPADYEQAMAMLREAAFKGNDYAQYALALIYEQGYHSAAGELVIQPDPVQAIDMYNIAAANDYGLAQYRLAEILVRDKQGDMSLASKTQRSQLIKQLYQGAYSAGVEQSALPLAYFNAMEHDKAKQADAFQVAQKEAAAGRAGAALLLGLLYDRGITVPADHNEALRWYQQAPQNPVSTFIVGTYVSQGNGMSKDINKAKILLQQAADAGFAYADVNLAVLKQQAGESFLPELNKALDLGNSTAGLLLADYYLSVANDSKQMQQARDIYQHLAEKGNRDGQLKLGFMFEQGLGGPVDASIAEKWYSLAANQGQVVAQYLLGHLYQLGTVSGQPDYAEAKKWYSSAQSNYAPAAVALGFIYDTVDDDYQHALAGYQMAAQQHDANGQFNLGLMYEQGKGRPVDFEKAQALYQEAANSGQSKAMVQLAGLLFKGLAGSRDEEQALQWYQKAAKLGDRDALYQLGLLAETGVGTKLDYTEAMHFYQQASDKGNAKAKLALARMYQYGLGIAKDNHQAEKLYMELAAIGNAYAQYQLATFYYQGIDGDPSPSKGKQLLQQAQDNGSLQARKILQWLDAQAQERSSFIEPIIMNQMPMLAQQPADLMYLDALNEWNRGDERTTRIILNQINTQFPQYEPAKRAYEQLNHPLNPAIKG